MGLELWLVWAGVSVVGAVLALDDTGLAQTWFSQPLPAALLVGLVAGDPAAAMVPGMCMQLMVLGNLPVGAATTLDATSATVGVVGGALVAGFSLPTSSSLLSVWSQDTGAQVGLMLVLMALVSHGAGHLVSLQRRNHLVWKLAVYREIRDGRFAVVGGLHRRALALTAARGAAVSLLVAVLVAMAWRPLLTALPARLLEILALAPLLTVPLAVGSLSERHGHRRAAPVLLVTVALGALMSWRLL